MSKLLLSIHVIAAIVMIGPVTVAASMFPPVARRTLADPDAEGTSVLRALHRITYVYAVAGILVPVFGVATAITMGVLGDTWLIVSMVLTLLAATILAVRVVPDQARVVAALDGTEADRLAVAARARLLSMTTGMFALTWAVVVVLMIVRPGSTTGA